MKKEGRRGKRQKRQKAEKGGRREIPRRQKLSWNSKPCRYTGADIEGPWRPRADTEQLSLLSGTCFAWEIWKGWREKASDEM